MSEQIKLVGEVEGVYLSLVPIKEASKIMNLSPVYIRRLADEGEIIAIKVSHLWLVHPRLIRTVAPALLHDVS